MITLKFLHANETKNKQRFEEVGESPKVGTLYLDKAEAGDATELTVTITKA